MIVRALEDYRLVRTEGNTETRLACFHEVELGNTTATAEERRSYRLEGEINCRPEGEEPEEDDSRSRRSTRGGR